MRACVKHGRHFLVEKPIASSAYGLDEIREAARDLIAHVGYNLRFHATVVRASSLISDDAIGRILHASFEYGSYLPGWRPKTDYRANYAASSSDGGIILDDIHEIDLACHILGMPTHIQCTAMNTLTLGIHHEETADIILSGQPMCPVTSVHMDYLQHAPTRKFKLIGTKGTLNADLNRAQLSISRFGADSIESYDEASYDPNEMYVKEMQHFLSAVQSGKSDESLGITAGIQTLRLALLSRKSSALKRSVEL
jgi:predicted dehydrogenase